MQLFIKLVKIRSMKIYWELENNSMQPKCNLFNIFIFKILTNKIVYNATNIIYEKRMFNTIEY